MRPKISVLRPDNFNDIVMIDLKMNIKPGKHILWMIGAYSCYAKGVVLKSKCAEEVVEKIESEWFHILRAPSSGLWGDNRTEFVNAKMKELCDVWKIKFAAGPPYSPWSNGLNERNHYSCDRVLLKLMDENKNEDLQKLINKAAWVHNTNRSQAVQTPLRLVTGLEPNYP